MRRLTHAARSFSQRTGRRGAVLLLFSLAFAFIGLKSILDPSQDHGHFVFYALLDPIARAVLWGLPAGIGIGTAWGRKSDALGFAALSVPTTFLTCSYLWSFVGFLAHATPYGLGWVSAVQWGLITAVLLIASGWAEVPRRTHQRIETVLIDEPEEDA